VNDSPESSTPDPDLPTPPEPAAVATPSAEPFAPPPPPFDQPSGPVGGASSASERPEVPIGAAFAGGFVLALILKRLAR